MRYRLERLPARIVSDPPASCSSIGTWKGDTYRARITNRSRVPATIAAWHLFEGNLGVPADTPIYGEGFQMLAQTWGTWNQPIAVGRCPDSGVYRITRDHGFHTLFGVLAFSGDNGWWLLGFSSCRRFSGGFRLRPEGFIEVFLDTEALSLAPGESWDSEPLEVLHAPTRHEALTRFAARVQQRHPKLPTIHRPTGWCSWYHYGPNITACDVVENLEQLKRRFPRLRYVQVDDGYQSRMGDWLEPSDRFDGGMDRLAATIRHAECEPALWVAPFIAEASSRVFTEHPSWFVKDPSGMPLPAERVTYGGWRCTPWYMLDGTHPDVLDHLRGTFEVMRRDWGIRYFKLDACYWGAVPGVRSDPAATRVEAYRRAMAAVIEGAGRDAFILGCNAPMWPSLGCFHGMRVSDDVRRDGIRIRHIARESLLRSWQNGVLWTLDPDCVCLRSIPGEQATEDDFAFHRAAHVACGGMVLSGDRLGDLDEQQHGWLELLLSHAARTGGRLLVADDLSQATWDFGSSRITCRFNWGERAVPVDPDGDDYWTNAPIAENEWIPPGGARVIRQNALSNRPGIGSNPVHTMKLYQLAYSHHCSKVRIAAAEKGLELELPAIPGGGTRSPEFLALNPLGQVPFLVDGDVRLGESEVIVEYLEDRHPDPPLLPADPALRARSRWLSRFHDLFIAKQLSVLYFALVAGRAGEPEMSKEVDELLRLLDLFEGQVEPAPYLLGRDFLLCDAAHALSFFYVGRLTAAYQRPVSSERIPKLTAWFDAISERPSVAAVIDDCVRALET